jgi:hypothetical protein
LDRAAFNKGLLQDGVPIGVLPTLLRMFTHALNCFDYMPLRLQSKKHTTVDRDAIHQDSTCPTFTFDTAAGFSAQKT